MEFRTFETIKTSPSLLGYGMMRLPTINDNQIIDEAETFKLLDYAYQNGITYYDTAYFYHGGNSEKVLGKWLQTIDRTKVLVTTKSPFWLADNLKGFDNLLTEQLQNLNTDYLDFYLLHACNAERLEHIKKLGLFEHLPTLKESGKVKHIGFSFHDHFDVFEEILTSYPWDFCQIQLNYMDQNYQAGLKGLKLAESLGIPVIIMEPIRGGLLANVPEPVLMAFNTANPSLTPAAYALKWVSTFPNVLCVLSGMSTFEQLEENIQTFNQTSILTFEEMAAVDFAQTFFNSKMKVKCTNCCYCMPCPFGVNIPNNFSIYNGAFIYDNQTTFKGNYLFQKESSRASNCQNCKVCVSKCPQNILIPEILASVSSLFDN